MQLYNDRIPPGHEQPWSVEKVKEFQLKRFQSTQLPLYVVLEPLGQGRFRTLGVYDEGKINNVTAFEDFLKKHLDGSQ